MRVLLIDVNCKNSSTGRIVYDLYTSLRASGEEAAVCYGRGENICEPNIFKFGLDWETKLHGLLTRLTGYTGCFSFFSTRRLLRFIKDFRPDVVHIHELHAYFVNIKPLLTYLKKQGIPTVCTLHCEFMYTGKCGHAMECEQWKTQCEKCPRLQVYPKTLFFDRTKHMFLQKKALYEGYTNMTITAPSSWLMERAKQSVLADKPSLVIPNGIDTEVFCPRESAALRTELGIHPEEKVVLALAPHVMNLAKGGPHVLELAKNLAAENIRFVMVGADDPEISVPDNVILKGAIYDKDLLAQYYSLADAFVICSTRENFPTTCLEAQCCGTPVYGYDTGGTRETLVEEGDTLVPYGDIQGLAQKLLTAPIKTEERAEALRDLAEGIYGKRRMFAGYRALYAQGIAQASEK